MIAKETLDVLFSFHPPTIATTPRFALLARARKAAEGAVLGAWAAPLVQPKPMSADHDYIPVTRFDDMGNALRAFFDVINEHSPDGPWKGAALNHVLLARNAANERLKLNLKADDGAKQEKARELRGQFMDNLLEAQWLANRSVALDGKL